MSMRNCWYLHYSCAMFPSAFHCTWLKFIHNFVLYRNNIIISSCRCFCHRSVWSNHQPHAASVGCFRIHFAIIRHVFLTSRLRAARRHLPCGITQCYLLPDTSELILINTSQTGWYSIYLPRRDGRLS